jgi:hypothetical protein
MFKTRTARRRIVLQLFEAIEEGNVDKVKELAPRCDVSKPYSKGGVSKRIDLVWFACHPDISVNHDPGILKAILEALVNAGADVDQVQDHRAIGIYTPLMDAIAGKRWSLFKILLELGANCNLLGYRQTALCRAVDAGPEYVSLCLQYGAQLTKYDDMLSSVPCAA